MLLWFMVVVWIRLGRFGTGTILDIQGSCMYAVHMQQNTRLMTRFVIDTYTVREKIDAYDTDLRKSQL